MLVVMQIGSVRADLRPYLTEGSACGGDIGASAVAGMGSCFSAGGTGPLVAN